MKFQTQNLNVNEIIILIQNILYFYLNKKKYLIKKIIKINQKTIKLRVNKTYF